MNYPNPGQTGQWTPNGQPPPSTSAPQQQGQQQWAPPMQQQQHMQQPNGQYGQQRPPNQVCQTARLHILTRIPAFLHMYPMRCATNPSPVNVSKLWEQLH